MRKFYSKATIIAIFFLSPLITSASYPTIKEFSGKYELSAELTLEDRNYEGWVTESFIFAVSPGYTDSDLTLTDFLSNASLSGEYDSETGELRITTVTLRHGEQKYANGKLVEDYDYLGLSDKEGNWNGFSSLYSIKPVWQVEEDGNLSIPDFTLVDYADYNSTKEVKIVASYSNVKVRAINDEEDPSIGANFYGTYDFIISKTTEYIYEKDFRTGKMELANTVITDNTPIRFTINEYDQMWTFGEYELPTEQLNSLRNRGYVNGNQYIMETDIYNGLEWMYYTDEETDGHTDAKLFGNASGGAWMQGRTAFILNKNEDETFSLTNFSLYQRTMEDVEGEGSVDNSTTTNQERVYRMIKLWEDWKFVSYAPEITPGATGSEPTEPEEPEEPEKDETDESGITNIEDKNRTPRYFNLQGVETSKPDKGVFIKIANGKAVKIIL